MHYPTMKTERPLFRDTLDTTNPCAALISEKIGREPGALVFGLYPIRCQRPKYTNGTNLDDFYRPYLKQYGSEVEKACHEMALATLEESEAKVVIMCGKVVHDFIVANLRKLVPISVAETYMFDEFDHIRAQLDNKGNICRLYFTTYHPGDNPAAQTDSECAITLIGSREFHASWQQSRSGYSKRHAFQPRMRVGGLQSWPMAPRNPNVSSQIPRRMLRKAMLPTAGRSTLFLKHSATRMARTASLPRSRQQFDWGMARVPPNVTKAELGSLSRTAPHHNSLWTRLPVS
jgi:hypothetical protein